MYINMHQSGHTHLHEDVGHKLAGGLVQDLGQQRLALVALHVDLDDDGVGGDLAEDLGGGGGHGGRPDHLVYSLKRRLSGGICEDFTITVKAPTKSRSPPG